MALTGLRFLAVVLAALTLVPAGAHLFELPHKLALARDDYLAVQGIYAGWQYFGIVYAAALGASALLAVRLRRQRLPFALALAGTLCLVAFFAVFFAFTFPANVATQNWTVLPANWEALRRQWEYSHAANAAILFAGFLATTLAALIVRPEADQSSASRTPLRPAM